MLFARLSKVARTASFRFAAIYAGLFALSAAVVGAVAIWTVVSAVERNRTQRIESEIAFFNDKYNEAGLGELVEDIKDRIRSSQGAGLYYAVIGSDGKPLTGNLALLPGKVGWRSVRYPVGAPANAQESLRVLVADFGNSVQLAVGDDFAPIEEIKRMFVDWGGWILAALVLVGIAAGWMLSVATLHRVDAITRTANAIIEGDLSSRVPLRGTGDDLDRLAETLNRMLDRISGLLENLRQVSNDIAHDLRTPLTRLRNRLSAASAIKGEAEHARAVELALIETDGILNTFTAMLRIAQLESGTRKAGFRPVDLSLLVERLAEDYRPAAEDEGKSLAAAIEPGLSTVGDKELLTNMVANLIDNAIQHTARDTTISVTLTSASSAPVVEVADDGLGVPEDQREKVFRRFYRLDRSRTTEGSGLGLAFVAAVAELHHVEIKMLDNSPGLRVRLQFPRPSAPMPLS